MTAATTTTIRIAPLEPPYDPETEDYLTKLTPPDSGLDPLKLFRTLAVNRELASRMRPLGAYFLAHANIEPRDRELVILRTCARNGAEYEWGVHATLFSELSQREIEATFPAVQHAWAERDALLLELSDELHYFGTLSDETWERLRAHWTEAQLLELIVLAGWYRTISYAINALGIELEEWARRFPEVAE
jgi:4-carboxymuconolactone decarboxylase